MVLGLIPLYAEVKFGFIVFLILPGSSNAQWLYNTHIEPFIVKHEEKIDAAPQEMAKFVRRISGTGMEVLQEKGPELLAKAKDALNQSKGQQGKGGKKVD